MYIDNCLIDCNCFHDSGRRSYLPISDSNVPNVEHSCLVVPDEVRPMPLKRSLVINENKRKCTWNSIHSVCIQVH